MSDVVTAVPARLEERVRALCLACLGPAAVTLLVNALAWTYLVLGNEFEEVPTFWHVAQGPATVLGGSLLGVMLGVWAPMRTTPVIALVSMVVANSWLSAQGQSAELFGPLVGWVDWGPYNGEVWYGLKPGSAFWHIVYLLGLCGMAAAGAVVAVAQRRRLVMVAGVVAVGVTALGGVLQLP